MRVNYSGNKKRREEANRKKQEEKRNRRLNKSKNKEAAATGSHPEIGGVDTGAIPNEPDKQ